MQLQQLSLFDDIETPVFESQNSESKAGVNNGQAKNDVPVFVDRHEDISKSHLFVAPETPLDNLHAFAESIGLKGPAYQAKGVIIPHYQLTKRQRDKALAQGANYLYESEVNAMTEAWRLPSLYITISVDPTVKIQRDVRRTLGFRELQPGALMKAGIRILGQLCVSIKVIRVVSVQVEPLSRMIHDPEYGQLEATREGYPKMTGEQFVKCFCQKYKVVPATPVTRIVFKYV
tara:strand:- start:242 stop:937 length:696 start_codon:yes stop_codon:yes gene_type:complete